MTEISQDMQDMGARARAAASILASVPSQAKTQALMAAADALDATRADVLAANALDMEAGREKGLSAAMLDRLLLDNARIDGICGALRAIAAQDDPVGHRPTGLHIQRVRTPLGVIGVIYESRPNVTADAGALCLKAGNAVILRGGSESANSSRAIHAALVAGLRAANLPEDAIQLVQTTDRAAVSDMLRMVAHIDVIVPRGGKGLVGLVQREARVRAVVLNAKTRRTGICGSAECLLLHRDIVDGLGADILADLASAGVELRVGEGLQHLPGTIPARPDDFGREFLDMILAVAVVDDVAGAIAHIRQRRRRILRPAGQRDPDAQRLDPIRRWGRVWLGRRDRHRHRQDACARAGGGRAIDQLQVFGHRRWDGAGLTAQHGHRFRQV